MLVAHLVPGYFAAALTLSRHDAAWSREQRAILWAVALGSTAAPDADVIYNALFRGFLNHSTLWTHSLFVYLGFCLLWWWMRRIGRWPYLQTLVGLIAVGGLSHLSLDMASHGTPLLYPVSLFMFGAPSSRVLQGGFPAYITDPLFLVEPALLTLLAAHWVAGRKLAPVVRNLALSGLAVALVVFAAAFLLLLPTLRSMIGV